jgi:hypothetical protein
MLEPHRLPLRLLRSCYAENAETLLRRVEQPSYSFLVVMDDGDGFYLRGRRRYICARSMWARISQHISPKV